MGAGCPPSADGLRLGQSVCPETHVFGGTEWERAKPDPRAGHGQSKDRSRGWCGPQRAARGHGHGGDDAIGGACLLTFRGRSVGRTNKQRHARAGVSGRQPDEPLPCPSDLCETRAPRGSPLINPPELSSPPPAEGTGRALQTASGTRNHIAKDGEPTCGKVWLDAPPQAGRPESGGRWARVVRQPLEGRPKHTTPHFWAGHGRLNAGRPAGTSIHRAAPCRWG